MSSSRTKLSSSGKISAWSSASCVSSASFARNEICRRMRSIALLRATLTNNARGFAGTSDESQRSSAAAKASWSASSARSKSPTRRISVASARPVSSRNIFSILADGITYESCPAGSRLNQFRRIDHDRPNLDRSVLGAGNSSRDRNRRIEVLGFDQIVAAELLAGFGKRAVGGQNLALAHPHRGRRRRRLQSVAGLEMAALDNGLRKRAVIGRHLLTFGVVHFEEFGLASVDHQQILHRFTPCETASSPATSRVNTQPNDIFTIIIFGVPSGRKSLDAGRHKPHALDVSRPDGRSHSGRKALGEESPGSIDIRCRIPSGGGNPRETATENERRGEAPKGAKRGKGEKVR